jgi:hypothetical protein
MFSLLLLIPLTTSATPMTSPDGHDDPHARCTLVNVGMNLREALAIMRRPPDSTLSGHSAAGAAGDPPAGSFAIDFWQTTDAQGVRRTSALRYSGGTIESVDCGRVDVASAVPSPLKED